MIKKDLAYAFVTSLIFHILVLAGLGLTKSFRSKPIQLTPSYEVSLVRIVEPPKKVRRKKRKKIKKVKKVKKKVKRKKPKKTPPPKKKKQPKPVLKDPVKVAAPPQPPPPKAPPPPPPKPAPPPPPKPVSNITRKDGAASQLLVESPRFPYQFYVDLIHRKIMSNWFPDAAYIKPGAKINITVYFRVRKSGEITDLKMVSGSGEEVLDKSAISAIISSKPLPPLPDLFEDPYLGVNFRFLLHGVQWGE